MREIAIKPITNSRCLNSRPEQKIAWVYQSNTLNISNADDFQSRNCVGARCTNRSLELEIFNCSSNFKPFCQNGTKSTTCSSWKNAEQVCNNNSDFSVFNHKTICWHDSVNSSNLYWTGYKRYWYESTSNSSIENIESLSEVLNCSYMTCSNDGTTAIQKHASCSEKLDGYACLVNRETKTTSKEESIILRNYTSIRTKHPTTTKSNADTSNNQHKGHVTSTQIVSRSGSKTTITNTATSGTSEKLAKKPSYIVAIISSGVLLAICRARRQGPFKRKEQKPGSQMTEMHDPNYHDFETAPHNASSVSHSNTAYNTHTGVPSGQTSENMKNNMASNNEYSVVVKDKKSSQGANGDNFDQKEENSSDFMDNDYDRLNQIRIPSDNYNSNNIYDSSCGLRDEDDPTYNTTYQISGRNNDGNSVYDHT
ncbi:uncharacterized protein LOC143055450 isoform X2 [Mytilus galloprovincialis]|uniref:uncharacterized protein LOC143055450 isoform X2 n=1 Tax=Mytilus galloprovincialis TaxID=29158 RepID=UPI003F7C7838